MTLGCHNVLKLTYIVPRKEFEFNFKVSQPKKDISLTK